MKKLAAFAFSGSLQALYKRWRESASSNALSEHQKPCLIRLENVVTVWRSSVSNREDYHSVLLVVEEAASSNLVVPTILLNIAGVFSV